MRSCELDLVRIKVNQCAKNNYRSKGHFVRKLSSEHTRVRRNSWANFLDHKMVRKYHCMMCFHTNKTIFDCASMRWIERMHSDHFVFSSFSSVFSILYRVCKQQIMKVLMDIKMRRPATGPCVRRSSKRQSHLTRR